MTAHVDTRVLDAGSRGLSVRPAGLGEVAAVAQPLFREYGEWVAAHLAPDAGIALTQADLDRHHHAFRAELPDLLGRRGRLLIARLGQEPVGVGALKPVDHATVEIKRMFVRPTAQGRGIGRAILEQLVHDAAADGNATARLETLRFMTAAHALYRSVGFVDTAAFAGSEASNTVLGPLTIYMRLDLRTNAGVADQARYMASGR